MREGHFADLQCAAKIFHPVGDGLRDRQIREPHCIGGNDHEERVGREERAHAIHQIWKMFFKTPGLILGTTAEFWWVEDDPVIGVAASLLARDELHGVVRDPANGAVVQV